MCSIDVCKADGTLSQEEIADICTIVAQRDIGNFPIKYSIMKGGPDEVWIILSDREFLHSMVIVVDCTLKVGTADTLLENLRSWILAASNSMEPVVNGKPLPKRKYPYDPDIICGVLPSLRDSWKEKGE